ncbi:MAG: M28 family metallopeptidase [Terriglobia bacterium]
MSGGRGRFEARRDNGIIRRSSHILLIFLLGVTPGLAQTSSSPAAVATHPPASVSFNLTLVPASVLEKRLAQFKGNNMDRENTLRTIFSQAGCSTADITTVEIGWRQPPDLICTLPGRSQSEIIVGGHFDYVYAGQGVVDDWSGASLLPTLYQSLSKTSRRHTFLFIGFSNEEKGLAGSRYYVSRLSREQKAGISAMVNLECLGMNDAEVWGDHADPVLLHKLLQTARALHFPLPIVNVERVGTDDAESFRRRNIPTLTVHSLTQDTLGILHSPRDRMSAINRDYYYENYRLVVAYLAYLDQTLN